jgi:hypothetical protein
VGVVEAEAEAEAEAGRALVVAGMGVVEEEEGATAAAARLPEVAVRTRRVALCGRVREVGAEAALGGAVAAGLEVVVSCGGAKAAAALRRGVDATEEAAEDEAEARDATLGLSGSDARLLRPLPATAPTAEAAAAEEEEEEAEAEEEDEEERERRVLLRLRTARATGTCGLEEEAAAVRRETEEGSVGAALCTRDGE